MNSQEARLVLCACRPDGQDQNDPAMKKAMDCAEMDAQLASWFSREQTLDVALSAKVGSIVVPETLKSEILAGARVAKPLLLRRRVSQWLTVAAAVTLAAVVVWNLDAPRGNQFSQFAGGGLTGPAGVASFATFRTDAANAFAEMQKVGFTPDLRTNNVMQANNYLSERVGVSNSVNVGEVVDQLGDARLFGCRIVDWRGHKVSMLCLNREGEDAHLFVIHREALSELNDVKTKQIHTESGYPVTAWRDANNAYVLVGHKPDTDLGKFF
jgi:hypothetical protein